MDGDHSGDYGELRGKVESLESGLANLGGVLDRGLKSLGETIQRNQERTDERIANAQQRTDQKFETFAASFQQSSTQRSTNMLAVIGMLLTFFVGMGGLTVGVGSLAFTFYTLTKAPIDSAFASVDKTQSKNESDIKENAHRFDAKIDELKKGFVPVPEIKTIEENVTRMQNEGRERDKQIAAIGANQVRNTLRGDEFEKRMEEHHKLYVDKDLFDALSKRVDHNEERQDQLWEKNYATSKFPCLESGAGCGPIGPPGPTSLPSGSSAK